MVLFNQIANFLRISGDTYHSIECFRKVLHISHNNADALLNLARILFNLRFINDAIFLAERSLDQQSMEQTTWLQHYTLGEFFEGNGEYERAFSHFQMALDFSEEIGATDKGYYYYSMLHLGRIEERKENPAKAREYYKQVKKITKRSHSANKQAKEALKRLEKS